MIPVGTQGGQFNGGMVGGGVRLHYTHWAFDFTLLHVLETDSDAATVPFFEMTWRQQRPPAAAASVHDPLIPERDDPPVAARVFVEREHGAEMDLIVAQRADA